MMKPSICLQLAAINKANTRHSTLHQDLTPAFSFKDAVANTLNMKEVLEWLSNNSEFNIEDPNASDSNIAFLAD